MADFGYDISNFTNVDGLFGTLADFQRMSERAHELGKKLSNETCLCSFTVIENVIMTNISEDFLFDNFYEKDTTYQIIVSIGYVCFLIMLVVSQELWPKVQLLTSPDMIHNHLVQ